MKRFLNTEEAAEYLGYHPQTLKRAREFGILGKRDAPKFKVFGPRKIRYDINELDAWMDAAPDCSTTAERLVAIGGK